jgi:hypothetical protein
VKTDEEAIFQNVYQKARVIRTKERTFEEVEKKRTNLEK